MISLFPIKINNVCPVIAEKTQESTVCEQFFLALLRPLTRQEKHKRYKGIQRSRRHFVSLLRRSTLYYL